MKSLILFLLLLVPVLGIGQSDYAVDTGPTYDLVITNDVDQAPLFTPEVTNLSSSWQDYERENAYLNQCNSITRASVYIYDQETPVINTRSHNPYVNDSPYLEREQGEDGDNDATLDTTSKLKFLNGFTLLEYNSVLTDEALVE
jgi:hypothetical protein